ncbi:hypothetical protein [Pseudomonas amygdali]|uniref:Uncharacterized protein n=1 Tax=Pseudomonas amygdali pv. lachrymans str. M301315 TaxID=629260 RepID=A0AAD0VA27_PSEAV|nr:hypothetical protein [Pseudomonas amygdali]AXH60155.1 hypothetical protein PLA107_033760 [Pseudomonas amygdali pv. lachrymans str. M301315]RMT05936.1 hypothetical protein ALP54_03997 [Pseudomonas amygdali pv. lachrymans]
MKSFIERNPKEQAVEESLRETASSGYTRQKRDPADNIFEVVARIKRQSKRRQVDAESSPSI